MVVAVIRATFPSVFFINQSHVRLILKQRLLPLVHIPLSFANTAFQALAELNSVKELGAEAFEGVRVEEGQVAGVRC